MCEEIIKDADRVSRNGSANVLSTVLTNFPKKARYKMDCYILHSVSLVITLLFLIVIVCYRYAKHSSKLKDI